MRRLACACCMKLHDQRSQWWAEIVEVRERSSSRGATPARSCLRETKSPERTANMALLARVKYGSWRKKQQAPLLDRLRLLM
jgi:hypothetical protein